VKPHAEVKLRCRGIKYQEIDAVLVRRHDADFGMLSPQLQKKLGVQFVTIPVLEAL
jgi:hypothetical protein